MSQPTDHYAALLETVAILRAPGGCPWDREQTHSSLTECLVEECSELLEAIDRNDEAHMVEELGDVLLNVVMQTEIAREVGKFDMEEVCKDINEKLIRRHPHVFEKESFQAENSEDVIKRWDQIKERKKKNGPASEPASPFKPMPPRLPALLFAKKTFKQAQKAELQNHEAIPVDKISKYAALNPGQLAEELFAIAAACRLKDIDPEQLTRTHTQSIIDEISKNSGN